MSRSRHARYARQKKYEPRPALDETQMIVEQTIGALEVLDGTERSALRLTTGFNDQEIDDLGGLDDLADWERELLEEDQPSVLRFESTAPRAVAWDEDDDLPDVGSNFLARVSIAEVVEAMPGGFVVETMAEVRSLKASGNMRVYELARDMNIDTRHLVRALRLDDEYVASHLAYVAKPVCDLYLECASEFRQAFGTRTTPHTWAQASTENQRLFADLDATTAAKARR